MAKAKEPRPPLKGEKRSKATKASATARVKRSELSEKMIVDSGSESESKPGSSSGANSVSESDIEKTKNTKKPRPEKVNRTEPTEPPVPSDTNSSGGSDEEDESSSDGEEDSEGSGRNHTVVKNSGKNPATVNGVKRKADQQSSSSEDSDDEAGSTSEDSQESPTKKAKHRGQGASNATANDIAARSQQAPSLAAASIVAARPFEPPAGFSSVDPRARHFGPLIPPSALDNVQVWHIAAPSDISLASIESVALDSILASKPVLSHKGANYILADGVESSDQEAFIMLSGGDGYEPAPQKVTKSLYLQQQIVLPNLSRRQANPETGGGAAGVARAAVSEIRPQPKGLRMRFKLPGSGSGEPSISDSESADEGLTNAGRRSDTVQFPQTLGANEGVAATELSPSKKSKKDKRKQTSVDGEVTPSKQRSETAGTPMTGGNTPVLESREDRAKRKEEKRAKKMAKKKS